MSFAVMAFVALQTLTPPPVVLPVGPVVPMVRPEWPWIDQAYSLRCEVSDSAGNHGSFALSLTDLGTANITGDDQYGLNTDGFVLSNESPPAKHPNVLIRVVTFDAGNLAYVIATQAFEGGDLQSTSFIARHTTQSDGIPNSHQVLGFCFPAKDTDEAVQ